METTREAGGGGVPAALAALVEALADQVAERVLERLQAVQAAPGAPEGAPMTYAEAAKFAGVDASTLRRAAARLELRVVRLGRRTVRITPADLQAWLASHRVGGDATPRLRRVAGGQR